MGVGKSFQPAIVASRLDLINCDTAPSAKMGNLGKEGCPICTQTPKKWTTKQTSWPMKCRPAPSFNVSHRMEENRLLRERRQKGEEQKEDRRMAVLLETSKGDVVIDLLCEDAPVAATNFIKLCVSPSAGIMISPFSDLLSSSSPLVVLDTNKHSSLLWLVWRVTEDQVLQQLPVS